MVHVVARIVFGIRARLLVAAAAIAVVSSGSVAAAPLPNAVSYEYFGFNFASNVQTSDTIGTLNYTGGPGCATTCTATTTLGADPSISVDATQVVFAATGGGFAEAELGYYFEYANSPGTYTFTLHNSDVLSTPGPSVGGNILTFGAAGGNFSNFNNFSSLIYRSADCTYSCGSTGAFTDVNLSIVANTLYFIQLDSTVYPHQDFQRLVASIDPTFTTTATGGQILFSPGVIAAAGIPEPATWTTMLAGFAAVGAFARRRRRSWSGAPDAA